MIEFETVMQQIETTKDRLNKAKERIPKLEEKIFDLTKKFTDAILDGASDEKLSKIKIELTGLEKELDILNSVDFDVKVKETLSRDEKIAKSVDEYIRQEESKLEKMVEEDEKLSNDVLDCYASLIAATKERQAHRQNMIDITGKIQDIKYALNMPIPSGGCFRPWQVQLKTIPHDKKFNQIRIANGQLPKY